MKPQGIGMLVMGALALRWAVQRGRLPVPTAGAMGVLLMAALAATASRVGLVGKLGSDHDFRP